jgi:hypothetical protein
MSMKPDSAKSAVQVVARVVEVVDAVGSLLVASRSKRPRSRIGGPRTDPRHVRKYLESAGLRAPVRLTCSAFRRAGSIEGEEQAR